MLIYFSIHAQFIFTKHTFHKLPVRGTERKDPFKQQKQAVPGFSALQVLQNPRQEPNLKCRINSRTDHTTKTNSPVALHQQTLLPQAEAAPTAERSPGQREATPRSFLSASVALVVSLIWSQHMEHSNLCSDHPLQLHLLYLLGLSSPLSV